jgi:hypothetical protein
MLAADVPAGHRQIVNDDGGDAGCCPRCCVLGERTLAF